MFSSASPRRLMFLLLVVGLAFPSHASAATWDFGNLFAKAGGFFSALWTPIRCEIESSGNCGTRPQVAPRSRGCEMNPDGHCASAPTLVIGDYGCEIEPDGRCKS